MQKVDHSGERFGNLLALKKLPQKPYTKAKYLCRCDCGKETIVTGSNLITGHVSSCGCLVKKHGLTHKERLYNIWVGMKQRCRDKNSKDYPNYGGRGISVCLEWNNDYLAFKQWALSNGYNDSLSIDRIKSDGNYEPSNCRWATYITQNNNLKSNRVISFQGEEKTLSEWASAFKIPYRIVNQRFQRGWSLERIRSTPVQRKGDTNAASFVSA